MTGLQLIRAQRGLLARIARDLGVTRAAVAGWTRVPAERLPEVEASTGIPRHLLRPDICRPPCGCTGRRRAA
jgi:DNA-binding transcriptional regulator YdaS (Cro superfamily)